MALINQIFVVLLMMVSLYLTVGIILLQIDRHNERKKRDS